MKMIKELLFITGLISSFNAMADSFCTGKISALSVGRSGTVMIQGPGGLPYIYLCNTENKFNNVETSACKAIYSTLLSAQAQDRAVNITFNPSIPSCSAAKSWAAASNFNWVIVK